MADPLLTVAESAVALARQHGASDAFASASADRSVEFQMRDGQVERVKEATSRSLALRLWVDGRYSSNSTTDLRQDRLEAFVRDAVALSRALQADAARKVPDPALFAGRSEAALDLVDAAVVNLSRDQRLAWCQEIDARIAGKDKVISATSGVWDGSSTGAMVSTNGFSGTWSTTSVGWSAEVTVQDEGDRRPEGAMWGDALHITDLPDRAAVADQALKNAYDRLGSTRGPTRRGLMIVDNRSSGRLLAALLAPATGAAVQQGRSFWKGREGQAAVSTRLQMVDDPLLPRGQASRTFDSDGISARRMPLFADGMLKSLYIDTYYGTKLGVAPTTGGPSNRVVTPGARDLAAIVADAPEAVLVTSWLGGNSDPTTGDFSFGMRGHLVKDGKIGAPVGEMNVTGNLLTLFAGLVEVGSDPWAWSSMRAPSLVFDGVQFSGA